MCHIRSVNVFSPDVSRIQKMYSKILVERPADVGSNGAASFAFPFDKDGSFPSLIVSECRTDYKHGDVILQSLICLH